MSSLHARRELLPLGCGRSLRRERGCRMNRGATFALLMTWLVGSLAAGCSPTPDARAPEAKRAWIRRLSCVYDKPHTGSGAAAARDRGKVLARLYRGDCVHVLEGDPWPVRVRTPQGIVGYLHPSDEEHATWTDISADVALMRREVRAALAALPDREAFRTIPRWGLTSNNYPLVRKWVVEALEHARRTNNAERIKHLQTALRSIDLE